MIIYLNGKQAEVRSSKTISEFIEELKLKSEGIAVAVNSKIVRKDEFANTHIKEGDKVEIIHAVQGG